jgi:O-antigen/teichoic acid export membrane protein
VVQLAQALGSFLVQIVVARQLGFDGLAVFALLYGLIVLGAAVTSGLVGDSLTVMDRSAPAMRASLQQLALGSALLIATLGAFVVPLLHPSVDAWVAAWFAAAACVFVLEEVGRRLLMATLRFWSVVAADLVGLIVTLGSLAWSGWRGDVTLAECFAAIAAGQVAAIAVIVALLPIAERRVAPWSTERFREVWAYGRWRAVQQLFRPTTLTGLRLLSIGAAGTVAAGRLEAARIMVAPAIHVVAGISNHLFAGFARDRDSSDAELVAATDRRVRPMLLLVLGVGAAAVLASWRWGAALTGSDDGVDVAGLLSWTAYAAATAAAAPYLALAAARSGQRRLTAVRGGEATASVALVALLVALGSPISSTPVALAVVTAIAAVVVRSTLVGSSRVAIVIPAGVRRSDMDDVPLR